MPTDADKVVEISVVRSGGFGGLMRRFELRAADLDEAAQRELAALATPVIAAKPDRQANAPGQPDRFQYDVDIATSRGRTALQTSETLMSPAVRALVDWVMSRSKG